MIKKYHANKKMQVIQINSENFENEVLESGKTVLIDFYANWCGPCKMMSPIIDEIANESDENKVKICKVNVDENQDLAMKYNIMSIPTLIIFKDGKITNTLIGLQDKEEILMNI